jgi:hypothetical protein
MENSKFCIVQDLQCELWLCKSWNFFFLTTISESMIYIYSCRRNVFWWLVRLLFLILPFQRRGLFLGCFCGRSFSKKIT